MPLDSYLNDALLFAALSLVLVLLALLVRSPPRTSMLAMLIVVAVGVVGLWLYEYHGGALNAPTPATIVREAALALVAFGVTQIVVLFLFQTLLARRRIPRILNEFVIVLALIGYAIYRLYVIGVNFAGLLTTSAVVSGALALSARETLGNLWGGIALQLEKTCRIGDWVRFDNVTGQVVSIRWRHMAIATITNETIVVPNGMLMQNRVTVVGRRGEERTTWRRYVPFNVEYEIPPARVIAEVERALAHAQIPHVAPQPRPIVGCTGFLDSGIEYTVCYDLTSPAEMWNVDSQIRVHVYAALLRQGLGIPFPRRVVELRRDERPKLAEREIEHRAAALSTIDLFASLTDDERGSLARQVTTSAYVADEILFRAGEPADSLYLLAQGRVDILREGGDGTVPHKLATLRAPAYFGEMGLLLGQPRAQTVVAASDVVCYRLDKKGFDAIMQARPELAEVLAHVLAERQAANDAALQLLDAETRDLRKVGRTRELMRRIQSFFGLAT